MSNLTHSKPGAPPVGVHELARRRGLDADRKIVLITQVKNNPRSGRAGERYALYKNGIRLSTYVEKVVAATSTPAYTVLDAVLKDIDAGHVRLS